MAAAQLKATMMIPKDGKNKWTNLMQNATSKIPEGVNEGEYLTASSASFSDGILVLGGIAMGPQGDDGYNYPVFYLFDKDFNRIGGWPIDPSDWEDFQVKSIEFNLNDDESLTYILDIKEES